MWRNHILGRNGSSISTLAICLGVGIGGSLPEVGNLAQYYIFHNRSWDSSDSHFFNGIFITIGVLGIIICCLALYRRLLQSTTNNVVKDK